MGQKVYRRGPSRVGILSLVPHSLPMTLEVRHITTQESRHEHHREQSERRRVGRTETSSVTVDHIGPKTTETRTSTCYHMKPTRPE